MEDRFVKEKDDIDLAESLVGLYLGSGSSPHLNPPESVGPTLHTGFNIKELYSVHRFINWVKNELFGETDNPVYLTSVHRYKGAEADYVYILESMSMKNDSDHEKEPRNIFLLDHMMHKSPQTAQEEMCILYVAATRARMQNIRVRAVE